MGLSVAAREHLVVNMFPVAAEGSCCALLFLQFTLVLLAFNGCGAARALLGIAAGAVHMITVVLKINTQVILGGGAYVKGTSRFSLPHSTLNVLLLPCSLHPHNQSGLFYYRRTGEQDKQHVTRVFTCGHSYHGSALMYYMLYIWCADAPP